MFVLNELTSQPVFRAELNINNNSYLTGVLGEVSLSIPAAEHIYTVISDGYETLSGTIIVSENSEFNIYIKQSYAVVKFSVKRGTTPINNVTIDLSGQQLITGSLGTASFLEVPVGLNYAYTHTKEGYNIVSGDLYLRTDTLVDIDFFYVSVEDFSGGIELNIYPNPATEMLNIELGNNSGKKASIRVVDITGQLIYLENHTEDIVKLDLAKYKSGIYFITVTMDENSFVNKIQIVK